MRPEIKKASQEGFIRASTVYVINVYIFQVEIFL